AGVSPPFVGVSLADGVGLTDGVSVSVGVPVVVPLDVGVGVSLGPVDGVTVGVSVEVTVDAVAWTCRFRSRQSCSLGKRYPLASPTGFPSPRWSALGSQSAPFRSA